MTARDYQGREGEVLVLILGHDWRYFSSEMRGVKEIWCFGGSRRVLRWGRACECTGELARLIGWFLFAVSSMANERWEEGAVLTMVSSKRQEGAVFLLWGQYKQGLQLFHQ